MHADQQAEDGTPSTDPSHVADDEGVSPSLETLVRILDAELAASTTPVVERPSAQLIRFAVGDAVFAMAADQLSEVDAVPPVTFVPRAPPEIRGLVNLRGEVIVAVDLRRYFGFGVSLQEPSEDRERMIVLRDAGRGLPGGVIVDRVFGITPYAPETMTASGGNLPDLAAPFVVGSVIIEGEEVAIIDLPAIAATAVSWPEESSP